MIRRLLIANRGEIALRIQRTARRLGIETVAVHSDADADAPFVRQADQAVRIGPPEPARSYLDQQAVLEAARLTGADAIHPGYGFLSENATFAEACAEAGVVFVGPPTEAIRVMGSKDLARTRMQAAGVPVVPGRDGRDLDDAALAAAAREVGFPLLIKAAAGGGGKGMRVVRDPDEFAEALAGVRREAAGAFGDDTVLLERWMEHARHVEVQVFADTGGRCVHLYDRDCSLQRRHQKILEEAPAPDLPDALRAAMAQAAVDAARAVDYVGAGTVEFLVAGDEFFFLEMNTRLQVEHPVTEYVTGLDLVEWQLRVAAGEPLPRSQDEIACCGHAVEVRLYAEDPLAGFLPATGGLSLLEFPVGEQGVRIDSGVEQGGRVEPYYDPMIAKVIVGAGDRGAALARLAGTLDAVRLRGVRTNLEFLRLVLREPDLLATPVHTTWLEEQGERLLADLGRAPERRDVALAAALAWWGWGGDDDDPLRALAGFRLNAAPRRLVRLAQGDARWDCAVVRSGNCFDVTVDGERFQCLRDGDDAWRVNGEPMAPHGLDEGGHLSLLGLPRSPTFEKLDDPDLALEREELAPGSLQAPMPGQVIAVRVNPGDSVAAGDALVIIEAMKMEHTLRAPHDGIVAAVRFAVGDRVEEGALLVELDQQDA